MAGFNIHLKRILVPYILNVYLPSGLLVAASWISFFVPPDIVPGRMALLVTILLMLINISSNVISESPSVNSVDGLNCYVIGSLLFVAAALFQYAALLAIKYNCRVTSKSVKVYDEDQKCQVCNKLNLFILFACGENNNVRREKF